MSKESCQQYKKQFGNQFGIIRHTRGKISFGLTFQNYFKRTLFLVPTCISCSVNNKSSFIEDVWWADPCRNNCNLWWQIVVVQSDRLRPINQCCRIYIDACANISRTITLEHWWGNIYENMSIQKYVKISDVPSSLTDHHSPIV